MPSPTDHHETLAEGLALERAGHWQEACTFWASSHLRFAGNAAFAMRWCNAALRITDPDSATRALACAREADQDGGLADKLDHLEQKITRLRLSQYRIRGVAAFEAGDFEDARQHLEALAAADPDHPWAKAKARIAAGLAPGFAERLRRERPRADQRVFLTGCGRSGTWLLMAMLQGMANLHTAPGEQPLGAFLDLPDTDGIHLVKRLHNAYLHFDCIPADIKVLHVVRHPYDVLISTHLGTPHHITLNRLEGEHARYFSHLATRPGTCVIKFEDMVQQPDAVQERVEAFLGVKSERPFRDFHLHADLGAEVQNAMHGLRPLDPSTLHRWRTDAAALAFLREAHAHSDGTLDRFAAAFDYDLTL